ARLLPTADLVVTRTAGPPLARTVNPGERVTPEPAGAVLAQRWQIAPFSSAPTPVTVASVAGRVVGHQCAASVVGSWVAVSVHDAYAAKLVGRAVSRRSDAALVRAAQRGSSDAVDELFRRHWPAAHRAAWLVVRDAAAAEDIAQEAFLAALRS